MWRLDWDEKTEFWKVSKQLVGPVRSDDGPWYENCWDAWADMCKANEALRKFDTKHGIK
jgi:hypothetical protein